jgi:hypothetical protein
MDTLPLDVLLRITSFCPSESLFKLLAVSRCFYVASTNDKQWEARCLFKGGMTGEFEHHLLPGYVSWMEQYRGMYLEPPRCFGCASTFAFPLGPFARRYVPALMGEGARLCNQCREVGRKGIVSEYDALEEFGLARHTLISSIRRRVFDKKRHGYLFLRHDVFTVAIDRLGHHHVARLMTIRKDREEALKDLIRSAKGSSEWLHEPEARRYILHGVGDAAGIVEAIRTRQRMRTRVIVMSSRPKIVIRRRDSSQRAVAFTVGAENGPATANGSGANRRMNAVLDAIRSWRIV